MERVGTRGSLLIGEICRHRLKHRVACVGKRQRQQQKGLVILRPPAVLILSRARIFGAKRHFRGRKFFFTDLNSSKYWRLGLSPKVPFGATFGANSTIDPMNWYFRSKTHTGRGLFPVVFCQLLDLISYFWTKIFWTDFFFLDLMFPSQRRERLRRLRAGLYMTLW